MEKKQNKTKKQTLKEDLQDPIYINYNLLLKLEEIKLGIQRTEKINYAILEILNSFYQKVLVEDTPKEETKKEERESTFKNN